MNSRYLLSLFFKCIFLYISFAQSSFGLRSDPAYQWRSIKTKHFWVHYHHNLERIAQKTAKLAETIHTKLALKIKWEPALRTDIVLIDNTDASNGYATPIPYNKMVLFPVRPEMDRILEHFDDWLDLLLTHEYTHILTLDMTNGLAQVLKYIFGRLYFINLLQPAWIIEGFAVHQESLGGYGRNNSTYIEMIMRNEVADNSFDSVNDASHWFYREWPVGNQYLYGGKFIQYLDKKYGDNSFTSVFQKQSKNFWPYQASDNMEAIYGYNKDLDLLWSEWQLEEETKQKKKIEEIKKQPLTNVRLLNTTGFRSGRGRFDPSGKFLYYIQDANDTETRLFRYDVPNDVQSSWFKKQKHIEPDSMSDVNYVNFLSVGEKGKIFISDLAIYRHFASYYDIFRFDANNSKLERLSHGLRTSYVDYSKVKQKFVFVQNESSRYSISLSDLNFRKIEKIVNASEVQFAFTRFSPDGSKIAFSFRNKSSFSQIAILELEQKSVLQITSGNFNHLQPSWHPSGNRLLFSSDRSKGVYNLFAYNLQSKQISQLTNVVGGLFHPDVSPNGKLLAATSYNSTGFNQALLPYPKKNLRLGAAHSKKFSIKVFQSSQSNKKDQKTQQGDLPSQDYTPFASIAPLFWVPYFSGSTQNNDSYGFSLFSSDALSLNLYSLSYQHSINDKQITLEGGYTYVGFWPSLSIFYYTDQIIYGGARTHFPITSQSITGSISLPFIYFQTNHRLNLTYNFQQTKFPRDFNAIKSDAFWFASPSLSYQYQNYDYYRKSISSEDGRSIFVSAGVLHALQNVNNANNFQYQPFLLYREYLPGFFKNHVLRLTVVTSGEGSSSNFSYFYYTAGASLMYSFPVWQPDIGFYKIFPTLIRNVWFDVYFGSNSDGFVSSLQNRTEAHEGRAGAQLNVELISLYAIPLRAFVGYEYTFRYIDNTFDNHQVYYGITSNFISVIFTPNNLLSNNVNQANQDLGSLLRPETVRKTQRAFLSDHRHE